MQLLQQISTLNRKGSMLYERIVDKIWLLALALYRSPIQQVRHTRTVFVGTWLEQGFLYIFLACQMTLNKSKNAFATGTSSTALTWRHTCISSSPTRFLNAMMASFKLVLIPASDLQDTHCSKHRTDLIQAYILLVNMTFVIRKSRW